LVRRLVTTMALTYCTFEMSPCVFDEQEADGWVYYDAKGWVPTPTSEIMQKARVMTELNFRQNFPDLPNVPIKLLPENLQRPRG